MEEQAAAAEAAAQAAVDEDLQEEDEEDGTDIQASGIAAIGLTGGETDDDTESIEEVEAVTVTAFGLGLGQTAVASTTESTSASPTSDSAAQTSSQTSAQATRQEEAVQAAADDTDEADDADVPDEVDVPDEAEAPEVYEDPIAALGVLNELAVESEAELPASVTNVFGSHDAEVEEQVDEMLASWVFGALDQGAETTPEVMDAGAEAIVHFGQYVNDLINTELAGVLDDDAMTLLAGRDGSDPDTGVVATMTESVLGALQAQLNATSPTELIAAGASAEELATALGAFLKEAVVSTVQQAVDAAGDEIEATIAQYEAAAENQSEITDASSGLAAYVAAVSVKEGAFDLINDVFSQTLGEDDATLVSAVVAARAASTASHVIENALTDIMGAVGEQYDTDEEVTLCSEFVMNRIMNELSERLESGDWTSSLAQPSSDLSDDEKIEFLSAAIESVIAEIAGEVVADVMDDGTLEVLNEGVSAVKVATYRDELLQWQSDNFSAIEVDDEPVRTFTKTTLTATTSAAASSSDAGSSSGSLSVGTTSAADAIPTVSVAGSTGADASAGVSNGVASASATASVGTSLTQMAGDWEQTISVGASVAAQAYAGAAGIGAGAAFMAGVEVQTDFGGGETLIQRVATEGHAAAALGIIGSSLGAQASVGIKAYSLTRMETNTDIGDLGDVDANAQVEAGTEASAEATATVGLQNQLSAEAAAGYYVSASVDGAVNTDYGSVGGSTTVVAPGSAGAGIGYEAGYSDGTLTISVSAEVELLLAGVGLSLTAEINLFGDEHTRGSQEEITAAVTELADHIIDYDSDMSNAKLADLSGDLSDVTDSMSLTQTKITTLSSSLIEDYEELNETQDEIDSLEESAQQLRDTIAGMHGKRVNTALLTESKAQLASLEDEIAAKQEAVEQLSSEIESEEAELETLKVYYQLERSYATDMTQDIQSLSEGVTASDIAAKIVALGDVSTDDPQYLELVAEYQEAAANTFMNQSSSLIADVQEDQEAFAEKQEDLVDSMLELEAVQFVADNMSAYEEGGLDAIDALMAEKADDLYQQIQEAGLDSLLSNRSALTATQILSEVGYDDEFSEIVSDAEALSNSTSSILTRGLDEESQTLLEEIRSNPLVLEFLTLQASREALQELKKDSDLATSEGVSEALAVATANHDQQLALANEAKAALDSSVETLCSEHPLLQSQYKLDTCRDNIAELTTYLERDDLSDEERSTAQAELGGWQLFLDRNEARLEADASQMKEAYAAYQEELATLKEKSEYLSEIVEEDGLLSWLV